MARSATGYDAELQKRGQSTTGIADQQMLRHMAYRMLVVTNERIGATGAHQMVASKRKLSKHLQVKTTANYL